MSRKSSSAYSNHSYSSASVAQPVEVVAAPVDHQHNHRKKSNHNNKTPTELSYAVSDIYQQLNHRSASMVRLNHFFGFLFQENLRAFFFFLLYQTQSTLPSSMPSSSAYNVLPGYIGEMTNHYGMNQPRLSQLQTLEAKVKP